ncbi:hypothetical protein NY486_08960, partial [Enterobacter hormaechei]|nr:hypothetical protein [Enterobacter hormaechei]
ISIGMGGPISEGKPSGPAPAIKAVRVPKPPTHVVMWTPEPDPNAKYMNDTWDDDKVAFVTFGDAYHPASPLLPIAAADVVTLDFIRWHSSIMSHDYDKRLTGVKT